LSEEKISKKGGATLLEFDYNLKKYDMDILLAEFPPKEIPLDALTLKIDEDFRLENIETVLPQGILFKKGDYKYNPSLGDFGGYRIYVD